MSGTALVLGVLEAAVWRPPVTLQHPGEVRAEDARGLLEPTAGGDQVDRDAVVADEHPQPLPMPGDPPPRLISSDRDALTHGEHERPPRRLSCLGEPADRLIQPARRDRDPEQRKDLRDLAHRDAEFLVELRRDSDRSRPELRGGRPDRVRGLIGVAALRAFAATPATTPRDPKAPHMPTNLDQLLLVLINLVQELQLTAATRTRLRQPDHDLLINMIGHPAMPLRPVQLAGLASRPARILFRLAP